MTTDQIRQRLDQLKQEYELGETRLRDLTQQEVVLRETLLRISGAIQVLEELTADAPDAPAQVGAETDGTRSRS
jgi:hypothetical protein